MPKSQPSSESKVMSSCTDTAQQDHGLTINNIHNVSNIKIAETIIKNNFDQAQKPRDRISGTMKSEQIAEILRRHKIQDVTEQLDLSNADGWIACDGGGWGDVFRREMKDGRLVAVKRTNLFTGHKGFERVLKDAAKELHIWSKCDHPNVMKLIGFADMQGRLAMVSLWMENGDVNTYIQEHPEVDRINLCREIANGLCYFHENKMVHGDLKALNVLVSGRGEVKLTDLGSSTIKNKSISISGHHNELKSMNWAPPEIFAEGRPPDSMSDIYSLGMTILEIITGEMPFAGWDQKTVALRLMYANMPGSVGAPQPMRPICCIPCTTSGNHIWDLLVSCWDLTSENRPSAVKVRDSLSSTRLKREEMNSGQHGVSSYPVCCSPITITEGLQP